MTAPLRLAATLTVAALATVSLARPVGAETSRATFAGAVEGRSRGGSADCYTVARADGRARFMTLNAFRVGTVRYSLQAGFFGAENAPGRHDLVDDAPPGVTVLLVRSSDRRQWASAGGRITLSDDGRTARLRATLAPSVPARGASTKVTATIACERVEDVPDSGA